MLLAAFITGLILAVFGVLFVFFPKALEEMSHAASRVILNVENIILGARVPVGVLLFLLGAWVMWVSLTHTP